MMRVLIRFAAVLLLAGVTLAGCGGSGGNSNKFGIIDWSTASSTKVGPEIGNRSPNFRLKTPDGGTLELASYAGKPLLLNFFASWCVNCKEEMHDLDTAYRAGTQVIGMDYRESPETITKLAKETGATFPMVVDDKTDVARKGFKVTNLPVTILIDGDGIIREIVRGPVDTAKIAELIAKVNPSTPGAGS